MDGFEKNVSSGKEKPKNVVEVETPKGRYSVVYERHDLVTDPETVRTADGIVLEFAGDYSTKKSTKEILRYLYDESKQYSSIIEYAKREHKPIYFVDFAPTPEEDEQLNNEIFIKEITLPVVEALLGVILVAPNIEDMIREKKMTRRQFLKTSGMFTLGAYLSMPAWEMVFHTIQKPKDESTFARKTEKMLHGMRESLHPEFYSTVLDTRNTLIAQKAETIARMLGNKLNRKANVGIVIGASHLGIEKKLHEDEKERIKELRRDLGQNFSRHGVITRVDFEGGKRAGHSDDVRISIFRDPAFGKETKTAR